MQDVTFTLDMQDDIMLGSNFDVSVMMQNNSREERTVKMRVTLQSIYYTGVKKSIIKSKKFNMTLGAIKGEHLVHTADTVISRLTSRVSSPTTKSLFTSSVVMFMSFTFNISLRDSKRV